MDLWHLQPEWLKRLRLFAGIVWRPWYGGRMSWRLAWQVAFAMYPRRHRRTWRHVA